MMIVTRIVAVMFSMFCAGLVALRFRVVRDRIFRMYPASRDFLDRYYPLDLNVRGRINQTVDNVRGRNKRQHAEKTARRYGESMPGEAK